MYVVARLGIRVLSVLRDLFYRREVDFFVVFRSHRVRLFRRHPGIGLQGGLLKGSCGRRPR